MSKYRILEKEGKYIDGHVSECWYGVTLGCDYCVCVKYPDSEKQKIYIPKFIVQEHTIKPGTGNLMDLTECIDKVVWNDLKEFNNLNSTREYKRSLELKDGIVIE